MNCDSCGHALINAYEKAVGTCDTCLKEQQKVLQDFRRDCLTSGDKEMYAALLEIAADERGGSYE